MTQGCNSFFGQDNCIEVIPYLPESIEYQYSGEPKQVIYSNGGELSYELKEIYPDNTSVHVFGTFISKREASVLEQYCNQVYYWRTLTSVFTPVIDNFALVSTRISLEQNDGNWRFLSWLYPGQYNSKYLASFPSTRVIYYRSQTSSCVNGGTQTLGDPISFKITDIIPTSATSSLCQFIVTETFTDGTTEVRHEETRENCPDVVKIPASLDYDKAQKFDIKTSALGYIEAVNFTYGVNEFGVQTTDNIPSECINIYNVIPYVPIGLTASSSNVGVIREPITQVCSVRGSPPPKVIFNCGQSCNPCESCPDGTCAIICDDHVCCYDESGIAVKEIAIEDYCDG